MAMKEIVRKDLLVPLPLEPAPSIAIILLMSMGKSDRVPSAKLIASEI